MLILTEGPFGQAVADNLTQRINSNVYRLTDVMNNLEMLVKDVDFVAVALCVCTTGNVIGSIRYAMM